MPDQNVWSNPLGVSEEQAQAFAAVAATVKLLPEEMIRALIGRVIEADGRMRALGLNGLGYWHTGENQARDAATDIADDSLYGLPLGVRETDFMWPTDRPFPWSAEECKAAVLGYQVRWTGEFSDFTDHLRGMWEMSDGYAMLLQR